MLCGRSRMDVPSVTSTGVPGHLVTGNVEVGARLTRMG
jgi:hypothetical protein